MLSEVFDKELVNEFQSFVHSLSIQIIFEVSTRSSESMMHVVKSLVTTLFLGETSLQFFIKWNLP